MKDFQQYRDPALRALLKGAAERTRKSEEKQAQQVEKTRAASAAHLRSPDGPKTRPTATLADVLGTGRR